jgi:hypothetical protein
MIDSLLIIGGESGMADVVQSAWSVAHRVDRVPTISAALGNLSPADLILVLQHDPDEYSRSDVRSLLEKFPISRVVNCQSEWCASAGRTRQIWPPAICVSQAAAPQRIRQELEILAGQRAPLPWTAGLDEIFAFDQGG